MMGLWNEKAAEPQEANQTSLWDSASNGTSKPSLTSSNSLSSPGSRPGVRRLSSATASFDDLSLGPSTVVPPHHMREPSDAHETAAALEMAKHRLSVRDTADGTTPPTTPPTTTTTDSYAFAFDIDGVLIRGGRPIPEAIEAMKVLNGQNEYGVKV